MKFHHIGVAVKDISATAAVYVSGGYHQSEITYDPEQNVNICWLTKEGMPVVELLEPVDETSPINKTLEKLKAVDQSRQEFVSNVSHELKTPITSIRVLADSLMGMVEAVAIHGYKVSFLYNKNVGLIELVEAPANI